jgi:hypothetical protein
LGLVYSYITLILLFFNEVLLAQGGPPPDPATVDNGAFILFAIGISYAFKKLHKSQFKK